MKEWKYLTRKEKAKVLKKAVSEKLTHDELNKIKEVVGEE